MILLLPYALLEMHCYTSDHSTPLGKKKLQICCSAGQFVHEGAEPLGGCRFPRSAPENLLARQPQRLPRLPRCPWAQPQ